MIHTPNPPKSKKRLVVENMSFLHARPADMSYADYRDTRKGEKLLLKRLFPNLQSGSKFFGEKKRPVIGGNPFKRTAGAFGKKINKYG